VEQLLPLPGRAELADAEQSFFTLSSRSRSSLARSATSVFLCPQLMIADMRRVIQVLDCDVRTEEERSGIFDTSHPHCTMPAKALDIRPETLEATIAAPPLIRIDIASSKRKTDEVALQHTVNRDFNMAKFQDRGDCQEDQRRWSIRASVLEAQVRIVEPVCRQSTTDNQRLSEHPT
jgi:hypothetical protein